MMPATDEIYFGGVRLYRGLPDKLLVGSSSRCMVYRGYGAKFSRFNRPTRKSPPEVDFRAVFAVLGYIGLFLLLFVVLIHYSMYPMCCCKQYWLRATLSYQITLLLSLLVFTLVKQKNGCEAATEMSHGK